MAATCAWTFVGSVTASTGRAYTQKNWSTSYSGWQPQTSSETRVDPHPDISFPHFLLRREPAACSINYFPTRKTFSSKRISRLRSTPPLVATHAAVACDDAMTWDGWVVIGSHDSADGAGCLRIAGPGRDFFVCHRLPFRDLPHDVANVVGEAFHIPSVALLFDFVTGFFTLACNSLPAASRYPQYSQVGLAAGIVSPRSV
jgi:hypothetical protein